MAYSKERRSAAIAKMLPPSRVPIPDSTAAHGQRWQASEPTTTRKRKGREANLSHF